MMNMLIIITRFNFYHVTAKRINLKVSLAKFTRKMRSVCIRKMYKREKKNRDKEKKKNIENIKETERKEKREENNNNEKKERCDQVFKLRQ